MMDANFIFTSEIYIIEANDTLRHTQNVLFINSFANERMTAMNYEVINLFIQIQWNFISVAQSPSSRLVLTIFCVEFAF